MKEKEPETSSLGCMSCLLEMVGLLGFIYLLAHWGEVWSFVIGK